MGRAKTTDSSQSLTLFPEELLITERDYPEIFRRLYYHLYANSNSSRAERLFSEIAKLLLAKLADELLPERGLISGYLGGKAVANKALLPTLRELFSDQIDSTDRFHLDDADVRTSLELLKPIRLAAAPTNVLGEAFQALVGPRMRGERGQFFTPNTLVTAMVTILDPKPGETVVDPACGTGSFLLKAFQHLVKHTSNGIPEGQKAPVLFGADKDRDLARLAAALVAVATRQHSVVYNFNSLELENWRKVRQSDELGTFDVVLTNPPFGARIPIRNRGLLKDFSLGHHWFHSAPDRRWHCTSEVRPDQDPQILFLELCIRLLRDGGRMAIVLPEGLFGNKESGYLWDFVRDNGEITALLDCPRTAFQPSTDTKTNILFFKRNFAKDCAREAEIYKNARIPVAVAVHCGHDRRGRTQQPDGTPIPDDLERIAGAFHSQTNERRKYWYAARITSPYYLVPRFYDRHSDDELEALAEACGGEVLTLGEMASRRLLEIRKGHEVGAQYYGSGSIPFVRTSDIANWEVSFDPTKSVNEEVYSWFRDKQRLRAGDVLVVCDGRYRIGKTAILHEHNVRCVVQSHFRIMTCLHPEVLSPHALLYLFNQPVVQRQLRNLVFIQSTLGTLGKRLLALKLFLYPRDCEHTTAEKRFREIIERRAALLREARQLEYVAPEL